jgi:hypothetical protein
MLAWHLKKYRKPTVLMRLVLGHIVMPVNKFQPGDAVIVVHGRRSESSGCVCRVCAVTGALWLHLDIYCDDPVYCRIEFGPFYPSELIFNPALEEQKQQCLPLSN